MKEPAITVTDHAIIRFIERHYGFSIEPIREQIIKIVKGAIGAGASSHSVDNVTYCFEKSRTKPGTTMVTTVLERGMGRAKFLENRGK